MPFFSVRSKRLMIEGRLEKATRDLKTLRADCKHSFAKKVFTRNDTDYVSSYPRDAWNDCHCEDCGKMWVEYL